MAVLAWPALDCASGANCALDRADTVAARMTNCPGRICWRHSDGATMSRHDSRSAPAVAKQDSAARPPPTGSRSPADGRSRSSAATRVASDPLRLGRQLRARVAETAQRQADSLAAGTSPLPVAPWQSIIGTQVASERVCQADDANDHAADGQRDCLRELWTGEEAGRRLGSGASPARHVAPRWRLRSRDVGRPAGRGAGPFPVEPAEAGLLEPTRSLRLENKGTRDKLEGEKSESE